MFSLSFSLGAQSSLVAGLMANVQFYQQYTFSSSTIKTYGSYFRAYNRFCALPGMALVSALTGTLGMFVAFLASFLLALSVCLCFNFVGLLRKEHVLPNPLVNNWLISSVIRGIH